MLCFISLLSGGPGLASLAIISHNVAQAKYNFCSKNWMYTFSCFDALHEHDNQMDE